MSNINLVFTFTLFLIGIYVSDVTLQLEQFLVSDFGKSVGGLLPVFHKCPGV